MTNTRQVTPEELAVQRGYMDRVREHYERRLSHRSPLACVRTFGCQQNVSDSEHIKGMLADMGFGFTEQPDDADFILFNTCAVREHAEDRVFGNIGALKALKRRRPDVLIGVCGCMAQQDHVAKKLRESYPFVGLVFGTHVIHTLPELLFQALGSRRQVQSIPDADGVIAEGLSVRRDGSFKAFLPIMYGCNNFCTYCVVPYVRGRERSRDPACILEEARQLVAEGYTDITLLGQNVNSYGKNLKEPVTFAQLLEEVEKIEGLERIRFMTSHPKDLSDELIEVMGRSKKICKHLHLPLQSGSSRILKIMNRRYDKEHYLELVDKIRAAVPDIALTTDIIVGFPGETEEDFEETMDVVRKVRYDSAFTFIYSKRTGTPAASMEEQVPEDVIKARFDRLLKEVQKISAEKAGALTGQTLPVLIEEQNEQDASLVTGRLSNNSVVHLPGTADMIGKILDVKLTECRGFYYLGERADGKGQTV